jgi:hypothetical protein
MNLFEISARNVRVSRDLLGISEWLSPWEPGVLGAMELFWFVAIVSVVLVVALRVAGVRFDRLSLLLSAGFLALSLSSARFAVFWAIVNAPVFAQVVQRLWRGSLAAFPIEAAPPKALFSSCVLAVGALGFLSLKPLPPGNAVEMFQEVKREIPNARIFNYRELGGALEYVGYGGWTPYIDGRLYLYDERVWRVYEDVAQALKVSVVEAVLSRHDLLVLHEGYHAALIRYLEARGGVRVVRRSHGVVVYATGVATTE